MFDKNCMKCLTKTDGTDAVDEYYMCSQKFHKEYSGLSSSEERVRPLKKGILMLIYKSCRNIMQKVVR